MKVFDEGKGKRKIVWDDQYMLPMVLGEINYLESIGWKVWYVGVKDKTITVVMRQPEKKNS